VSCACFSFFLLIPKKLAHPQCPVPVSFCMSSCLVTSHVLSHILFVFCLVLSELQKLIQILTCNICGDVSKNRYSLVKRGEKTAQCIAIKKSKYAFLYKLDISYIATEVPQCYNYHRIDSTMLVLLLSHCHMTQNINTDCDAFHLLICS